MFKTINQPNQIQRLSNLNTSDILNIQSYLMPIKESRIRLISILSKPILIVVVVVVIDVVFVKKMLGPKNFRQTFFGSNRVRSKKVVVQKNFGSKKFCPKNYGSKKFWVQKKFGFE